MTTSIVVNGQPRVLDPAGSQTLLTLIREGRHG